MWKARSLAPVVLLLQWSTECGVARESIVPARMLRRAHWPIGAFHILF